MDINLALEGLKFMILGMVTVFSFLILMVTILKIQSFIIIKFLPKEPIKTDTTIQNDTQLTAVITAAITEFKKQRTIDG